MSFLREEDMLKTPFESLDLETLFYAAVVTGVEDDLI